MSEKKYEFRELKSTDIFLLCKILSKVGVSKFRSCFESEDVKNLVSAIMGKKLPDGYNTQSASIQIMLEIAQVILENIPSAEKEIYAILANTSNLEVSEIKDLDIVTFADMIVDFITKEEFVNFIKAASRLLPMTK